MDGGTGFPAARMSAFVVKCDSTWANMSFSFFETLLVIMDHSCTFSGVSGSAYRRTKARMVLSSGKLRAVRFCW